MRFELCKLLILEGPNSDVPLEQLAFTDRWVKGLIERVVNVVRSYPDTLGLRVDRSACDSAFLQSDQSDSMKDSKQEELIEEESRWVESQIPALTVVVLIC